ncbi:MAG: hypothetical protein GY874_05345 [Desulfobacteraceae bacterium]|nr:hypothetical protein [Desulfobacteraceae bacterium]
MKFQDLFVPRWQNSSPSVRAKSVAKLKDVDLLEQIYENDDSEVVRDMASARMASLKEEEEGEKI